MSLRLKLLALGLATLVLPWGGCRYARQMEAALREGEQNSLQAVAQTIAASLQGRTDFLYREGQDAPQPAVNGATAGGSGAAGAEGASGTSGATASDASGTSGETASSTPAAT